LYVTQPGIDWSSGTKQTYNIGQMYYVSYVISQIINFIEIYLFILCNKFYLYLFIHKKILRETRQAGGGKVEMGISIGGWYDSNYFTSATRPETIDNTVKAIKHYMDVLDFDNIDLDWEYHVFFFFFFFFD
jgi:Glycosyl hydrolases family 18